MKYSTVCGHMCNPYCIIHWGGGGGGGGEFGVS